MLYKIVILCAVLLLAACDSHSPKENNASPEKYPVISPALIDTAFTKEYVAQLQSIQNVELRARVSGFLEKIHVDEGQSVKEGQILFALSSQPFQEDLRKAQALLKSATAELKVAQVELRNTQSLVSNNIVSSTDLEMATAKTEVIGAKIEEAHSAIATAQMNIAFTQIKAPFNGIINRIPNKSGSLIDEGMLLTTISDNKDVFAYFKLSEKEYLDFSENTKEGNKEVSLLRADNQLHTRKGKIETVESEIDPNTGTLAFRARFPNPEGVLKHGSSGKVLLTTGLKNALVIPQKSTFEIQENLYVYVVDQHNTVHMRSIVPKLRIPHLYVLESGLSPQDKVLYEGIQLVKEGDQITSELIPSQQGIFQHTRL